MCGQSTTSGPKRRNDDVISSVNQIFYFEFAFSMKLLKCCDVNINLPSSISGGNPPTKTFLENRSFTSEFCDCGDDLAGELIGRANPSTKPLDSSAI